MRKLATLAGLAAFALLQSLPAAAQGNWPEKPIRLVIPYPPGGALEVSARILVDKIAPALGQSIVVEARPGADGNLGTEAVAKSAPDGYTWLGTGVPFSTQLAIHPKSLRYDPRRDFHAVAMFGVTKFIVAIPATLPVNTLADFIQHAKANQGKLLYAGSARGSLIHLASEKFKLAAGIDMEMVPYAGQPPAIADLVAGRVQMMALGAALAAPLIKSGKLKGLAVLDNERLGEMPEIPTIVEAGFPELVLNGWQGIHVPAKTPLEVIAKINREVVRALADPELIAKFKAMNVEPAKPMTPEQFAAQVESEIEKWREVVASAKVETD
jgi:tripartite-type tricarboxylate transporter receptor subunit TctC